MDRRFRSAEERHQEILERAAAMGVDRAYISTLVNTFYGRIRADAEIGPIFESVIDDWAPHLARMKDFWASVALNEGSYSGRPVPAHMKLKGVEPHHFQIWLTLFRDTLQETAPSKDAAAFFMERAMMIAQSLQLAMFGLPELSKASPERTLNDQR